MTLLWFHAWHVSSCSYGFKQSKLVFESGEDLQFIENDFASQLWRELFSDQTFVLSICLATLYLYAYSHPVFWVSIPIANVFDCIINLRSFVPTFITYNSPPLRSLLVRTRTFGKLENFAQCKDAADSQQVNPGGEGGQTSKWSFPLQN